MLKEDKEFFVSKNKLDAKYNQTLTFFESLIIILATGVISISIFLLQKGTIEQLEYTISIGLILSSLVLIFTENELENIEDELGKLIKGKRKKRKRKKGKQTKKK